MAEGKVKVYFPGLNALRFFAAFLVFISHVELFKQRNGYANSYNVTLREFGGSAVTFFFVLSGFLITYLLFSEKAVEGKISARNFYIRRVLRIWPLYYLVVLAGFFIIPHIDFLHNALSDKLYNDFTIKVVLFLLFLPNISFLLYPDTPYIGPAWSIGVEEQFYLAWPLLIKKVKKPFNLFVALIAGIYTIKLLFMLAVKIIPDEAVKEVCHKITLILYYTRFECMIVGAVCAWLLFFRKEQALRIIYNRFVQIVCYFLVVVFLLAGVWITYLNHLIYSLLFGIIILNVSSNPQSLLTIDNKFFNYLGQVSFGIYMYHEVGIGLAMACLKAGGISLGSWGSELSLYIISALFTIIIAIASYQFFEKPFLNLKNRFAKIVS